MQELGGYVGGQGYEHAIDEEKIQRSEEIVQVAVCKTIAGRTHRRHQGGRYRHTRKYRSLFLAALLEDACAASEKCNQHVVNSGVGSGQELGRIAQVERGDQKVETGGEK